MGPGLWFIQKPILESQKSFLFILTLWKECSLCTLTLRLSHLWKKTPETQHTYLSTFSIWVLHLKFHWKGSRPFCFFCSRNLLYFLFASQRPLFILSQLWFALLHAHDFAIIEVSCCSMNKWRNCCTPYLSIPNVHCSREWSAHFHVLNKNMLDLAL